MLASRLFVVYFFSKEFAPGGDLFEVLKHQPSMTFTETEAVVRYLVPCLKALAYLQDKVSNYPQQLSNSGSTMTCHARQSCY